jgi:hypothetical protein
VPLVEPAPAQSPHDPANGGGAYAIFPHEDTLGDAARVFVADFEHLLPAERRLGVVFSAQRYRRAETPSDHAILGVLKVGAEPEMPDVDAPMRSRAAVAAVQNMEAGFGLTMCQNPDSARGGRISASNSARHAASFRTQQKYAIGAVGDRGFPQFAQPFGMGPIVFSRSIAAVASLAHPVAVAEAEGYSTRGAPTAVDLRYTAMRIVHATDSTPASLLAKEGV